MNEEKDDIITRLRNPALHNETILLADCNEAADLLEEYINASRSAHGVIINSRPATADTNWKNKATGTMNLLVDLVKRTLNVTE